jgi:hypothetical protein
MAEILGDETSFNDTAKLAYDMIDLDLDGAINEDELLKGMTMFAEQVGVDPPSKEEVH